MPQGLPAVRPTAYQARPGSRPAQRRLAVPEHPQARAQENAQCSAVPASRAPARHHARNHPPGPASAKRPQAEQATYAARPIRQPPNGLPGPAGGPHKATGHMPHHPQPRAPRKRPAQRGHVSQPGTAPPEPQQHGDQLVAAEPGPAAQPASPRTRRPPPAGSSATPQNWPFCASRGSADHPCNSDARRPAVWTHRGSGGHDRGRMGGTGRGAATGGAAHRPQRSAETPAGPAGKATALNPARACRNLGSTGRDSFAAAPIMSARSASASATDRSML